MKTIKAKLFIDDNSGFLLIKNKKEHAFNLSKWYTEYEMKLERQIHKVILIRIYEEFKKVKNNMGNEKKLKKSLNHFDEFFKFFLE